MNASLKGFPPSIYEDEKFIDVLKQYNCRSRAFPLNVHSTILELVGQELFHKPYLMISIWQRTLDDLRRRHHFFSCVQEVLDYYGSAKITKK